MGYMMLIADCVRCHQRFTCNPDLVPSVRVNGVREPICRECVEWANSERAKKGLPTWPIHPDAYEPQEV